MITLEKHLAAHASVNPGEEDAHLILCHCGTWFDDEGDHRAHVAATWREARTVRTLDQIDALAGGTVIRDACGIVFQHDADEEWQGYWWTPGDDISLSPCLPALVVWSPEDGAA